MAGEKRIPIFSDADIVAARQQGRSLAVEMGFASTDVTIIATAISELARNIVQHAARGEIRLDRAQRGELRGISIAAVDSGPGIRDIARAMQDGYSTARGLGLGLPGTKRLMDEFEISSEVGKGTVVAVKKWLR